MPARKKHALTTIQRRVRAQGFQSAIDRRSSGWKEMVAFRDALIADLGGEQSLSTQQLALVDLASRAWLMLSHVDSWLLSQDSILTGRGKQKQLVPLVRQRSELAKQLEGILVRLGLARKQKDALSVRDYVQQRYSDRDDVE